MRKNNLRHLWGEGKTAVNAWLTIPSPWTAEVLAHTGFDAVTIDLQHGLSDYMTSLSMLQAISTSGAVPLVRVPWNDPAIIMRLLDAGAYGVICPMINNRKEAETFVGACRYPPEGYRSYGPTRAVVYAGEDYVSQANGEILTFAMIETAEALRNLDEIAGTRGLDGLYIGPFDLSMSLGHPVLADFENPELLRALDAVADIASKHHLVAGIHAGRPENATRFSGRGFRLITPVNDMALLREGARDILGRMRSSLK
jgi:4-hydroxy-2-oxoheptanedioate aldolase